MMDRKIALVPGLRRGDDSKCLERAARIHTPTPAFCIRSAIAWVIKRAVIGVPS